MWIYGRGCVPCAPDPRSALTIAPTLAAPHLSHAERNLVVRAVREALDENNLGHIPLIAGTGALSTRETIELTKEAAEAGATQAMVIAPGYFAGALSKDALREFFVEVAKESPIPVSRPSFVCSSHSDDLALADHHLQL